MKILNGINEHIDQDPYGEEEWGDNSKGNEFITKPYEILRIQRGEDFNYLNYLKDNLLGKKISFIPYGREDQSFKFRKVINVVGIKIDRNDPNKLIFVDDHLEEHTYLNSFYNSEANPVKILN